VLRMIEPLRLRLLRRHSPPGVHAQGEGRDQDVAQCGYGEVPGERGIFSTAGGTLLSSAPLANTNTIRALTRT